MNKTKLAKLCHSKMATVGLDRKVKIWDLKTYGLLNTINLNTPIPISSLEFSQLGLLGIGYGRHVEVWNNYDKPIEGPSTRDKRCYMYQRVASTVESLKFCPFEDILGVGADKGFHSLVIPGSGEPNFDSFEANPYQNVKQRGEATIQKLLEKLQPETISLDPNEIGKVTLMGKNESFKKARDEIAGGLAIKPKYSKQRKNKSQERDDEMMKKRYANRKRIYQEREEKKLLDKFETLEGKLSANNKPGALDRFKPRKKRKIEDIKSALEKFEAKNKSSEL